jgi:hypothetical protein
MTSEFKELDNKQNGNSIGNAGKNEKRKLTMHRKIWS